MSDIYRLRLRSEDDCAGKRRREITVDVINKTLTLHVSDEELAKRKAEWKYEPAVEGLFGRYAALAKSANKGGVLDIKQFLNK